MTKPAEALKRPIFKDDVLHNHIADTYFYQKSRPRIRSRKKENHLLSLVNSLKKISLIFSIAIVSVILLISAITFMHNKYIDTLKKKVAGSKIVQVIGLDGFNKEIIKRFEFRGLAKNTGSKVSKDGVIITNPKKYNWGDLAVNFKFPIDISSRKIDLAIRGAIGGERVSIVIRDANNKSLILKSLYLSSRWKDEALSLHGAEKYIDLSRITHLRIECGYPGESSKESDSPINCTIFVKNLNLSKEI